MTTTVVTDCCYIEHTGYADNVWSSEQNNGRALLETVEQMDGSYQFVCRPCRLVHDGDDTVVVRGLETVP
jgi:hypothetical protein